MTHYPYYFAIAFLVLGYLNKLAHLPVRTRPVGAIRRHPR